MITKDSLTKALAYLITPRLYQISYDVSDQDYEAVYNKLASMQATQILESTWLIQTTKTATALLKELSQKNISYFISLVTNDYSTNKG
jgi:hypothetical protein